MSSDDTPIAKPISVENATEVMLPSEDRPITRVNLHEAIVTRLRDMITEGQLPLGSRINEASLCKQLGVSRTPFREAMKYLASEGLIELVPNRGANVRIFSPKDVLDSLHVLGSLEALAGKLACENATDAEIADFRATHGRMLALYAERNRLPYFKLNQDIHSMVLKMSGNQALIDVHGVLQARLKRIRYIGNESPDKWAAAVADHTIMMDALEKRDGKALAEILELHMKRTWERVKDAI